MSITAADLITNAYELIGVVQPGETPDAILMSRGLSRLNRMLGQWSLQALTIPCVARQLFYLTANLGVYTIGPGGNFDTSRPPSISGASLMLNNNQTPQTVVSLTRSGSVATATVTSHGRSTGDNVTISGASPDSYNGSFPITVTGASAFTYVFPGAVSSASGTITALFESTATDATEIPIPVITDDAEQAIQIKSLLSTLATYCYYNPMFWGGLGQIKLWPVPSVNTSALVLYRPMQLASFPNTTQQVWLPEGSEDALEYNLAFRLCAPNGVEVPPDVNEMRKTTLGTYKRGNTKMSDIVLDPMFTMERRGGYNILTGGYSGGGRS